MTGTSRLDRNNFPPVGVGSQERSKEAPVKDESASSAPSAVSSAFDPKAHEQSLNSMVAAPLQTEVGKFTNVTAHKTGHDPKNVQFLMPQTVMNAREKVSELFKKYSAEYTPEFRFVSFTAEREPMLMLIATGKLRSSPSVEAEPGFWNGLKQKTISLVDGVQHATKSAMSEPSAAVVFNVRTGMMVARQAERNGEWEKIAPGKQTEAPVSAAPIDPAVENRVTETSVATNPVVTTQDASATQKLPPFSGIRRAVPSSVTESGPVAEFKKAPRPEYVNYKYMFEEHNAEFYQRLDGLDRNTQAGRDEARLMLDIRDALIAERATASEKEFKAFAKQLNDPDRQRVDGARREFLKTQETAPKPAKISKEGSGVMGPAHVLQTGGKESEQRQVVEQNQAKAEQTQAKPTDQQVKPTDQEQLPAEVQLLLQDLQDYRFAVGDVLKLADLRATSSGDMPDHHREILDRAEVPAGVSLRDWATKELQAVEKEIAELKQLATPQ